MWLEITLSADESQQQAFSDFLEQSGAQAVTTIDAGDNPILEPDAGTTPLWPQVELIGLFPTDTDPHILATALQQQFGAELGRVAHRYLADRDWSRVWLDSFKPMRFGARLCICPSHCKPPPEAEVVVDLDPGLAFGTGTHPTTAMCLEYLDSLDLTGETLLDFGCGSGILAIAGLKLGADCAICVDNDPQALQATRDNAERNQVADRIEMVDANHLNGGCADAVVANILAQPLVQAAPMITDAARCGAPMALSGLLADQAPLVQDAYQSKCNGFSIQQQEEWLIMTMTRR